MANNLVEILLVEDNPSDVKLSVRSFMTRNIANGVHVVRDGAEALEFIFCNGRFAGRRIEQGPNLILLDLNLPLVNGLEVLRRIKADPRTSSIPVIVMTGSKAAQDVEECDRLGVSGYIVKPVDFAQLADVVKKIGFCWLMLTQPTAAV